MKLTKRKLKQIIKEELNTVIQEIGKPISSGLAATMPPGGDSESIIDNLPEGTKVYPDLDSMSVNYQTPDGKDGNIKVWGDKGIGQYGLYDLMEAWQLEFWYDRKQFADGQVWLHKLITGWLHEWGYDSGGIVSIDEETEDILLDMADELEPDPDYYSEPQTGN